MQQIRLHVVHSEPQIQTLRSKKTRKSAKAINPVRMIHFSFKFQDNPFSSLGQSGDPTE